MEDVDGTPLGEDSIMINRIWHTTTCQRLNRYTKNIYQQLKALSRQQLRQRQFDCLRASLTPPVIPQYRYLEQDDIDLISIKILTRQATAYTIFIKYICLSVKVNRYKLLLLCALVKISYCRN